MDKRRLSERDICTKFIAPALRNAGWDEMLQIREEVSFTKGRIIVRGKLVTGGQGTLGSSDGRVATVSEFRTLQNGYAFKSEWFTPSGTRLLRNANVGHGSIGWGETVHCPADRCAEYE